MSVYSAAAQEKRKAKEQSANAATDAGLQTRLEEVFNPFQGPNFTVSGSANERAGRMDGLERARLLTGQNPYQIGQDYQEAYGNIKKRTELSDTASELLRANKAGATADARQSLSQQGVKGGANLGAVSQIERAKSYDINNQLAQNQRQAEMDYMNAAKANANFTQASEMNFGAMAAGKDMQAPSVNSNGFGTVICTELYNQGYYSDEIYLADVAYGIQVRATRPHIYAGYRLWADPVVALMKKSKLFTALVALFAIPWARNMAGENNVFGLILSEVGEPLCGLLGKIKLAFGEKYAN
jgi:hypothetical protein